MRPSHAKIAVVVAPVEDSAVAVVLAATAMAVALAETTENHAGNSYYHQRPFKKRLWQMISARGAFGMRMLLQAIVCGKQRIFEKIR